MAIAACHLGRLALIMAPRRHGLSNWTSLPIRGTAVITHAVSILLLRPPNVHGASAIIIVVVFVPTVIVAITGVIVIIAPIVTPIAITTIYIIIPVASSVLVPVHAAATMPGHIPVRKRPPLSAIAVSLSTSKTADPKTQHPLQKPSN